MVLVLTCTSLTLFHKDRMLYWPSQVPLCGSAWLGGPWEYVVAGEVCVQAEGHSWQQLAWSCEYPQRLPTQLAPAHPAPPLEKGYPTVR